MTPATTRSGQAVPVPSTPTAASITATFPMASLRALFAGGNAFAAGKEDDDKPMHGGIVVEGRQAIWWLTPPTRANAEGSGEE